MSYVCSFRICLFLNDSCMLCYTGNPYPPVIEDRVWLAFLAKSFRGPVEVILADAHTIALQLL